MASTIVTRSTVRQSMVWLDVYYDLHRLFTASRFDLWLCIKECCILGVTSFLDIRLNVVTEKSLNGGPHLDVHKMFEKLGLTQEIGITLDRIRDLPKGQYDIRKRGGWGDTLFLSISSRLACSTLSSAFRFCFFCVRSAAFFIRANFEGDA